MKAEVWNFKALKKRLIQKNSFYLPTREIAVKVYIEVLNIGIDHSINNHSYRTGVFLAFIISQK